MTLKEIGWGQFLGSDPPLPPDVTFRVMESEAVLGELKAHKYFLASVSIVFRKQFFGKLAEKEDIIDIKETTYDAFKFQQLDEMNIEEANVVDVSRTALGFKHFEIISNQLITKCSDFLKLILNTDDDLADFCDLFVRSPEDQQMVLDLLNMEVEVDGKEDPLDLDLIYVDELDQNEIIVALPMLLRMCLKNVNWLDFLAHDSEVPPDVTFEIFELSKYNDISDNKVVIGEIKAHKYYLATVSEVFKEQFFSKASIPKIDIIGDSIDDKIKIVGPSFNAFKVMIDYIYGKYPTLRGADEICEIFEIINLAERYKISGLEEEYRTALFLYFRER